MKLVKRKSAVQTLFALLEAQELVEFVAGARAKLETAFAKKIRPKEVTSVSGGELGEWLLEQEGVEDVFCDDEALRLALTHTLMPDDDLIPAPSYNQDLEAAIAVDLTAVDPYLVYADWLEEEGDPMGVLIALNAAGDEPKLQRKFKKWLKDHELLGRVADYVPKVVQLGWHCGFVESIVAGAPSSKWSFEVDLILGLFLDLRVCQFLRRLDVEPLGMDGTRDASALFKMLGAKAPAHLSRLSLEGFPRYENVSTLKSLPTLRELRLAGTRPSGMTRWGTTYLGALPDSLERLALRNTDVIAEGSHTLPLRSLSICDGPGATKWLLTNHFPKLRELEFVASRASSEWLCDRLAHEDLGKLTTLSLTNTLDTLGTAAIVSKAPCKASVLHLSLSGGDLRDEQVPALLEILANIPELRSLDISENHLTSEGLSRLSESRLELDGEAQHRFSAPAVAALRSMTTRAALERARNIPRDAWCETGWSSRDACWWGVHRGRSLYEVFLAGDLNRYGCNCESRQDPCKHVIGLGLLARGDIEDRPVPDGLIQRLEDRYESADE